jgi:hypothetical protein
MERQCYSICKRSISGRRSNSVSSKKSSELSREKKPKGRLSPVLRGPRKKSLIKE